MSTESTLPTTPKGYRPLYLVSYVLITILLVCIASMAGFLYGFTHSPVPTKIVRETGPVRIVMIHPNASSPPYRIDLDATNDPDVFVHAFSQALTYLDADAIAAHTETKNFVEICHKSYALEPRNCNTYGWSTFSAQLTQDEIEIQVDPYGHMVDTPPAPDVHIPASCDLGGCHYLTGLLENRPSSELPLPHYGSAIFSFHAIGSSAFRYWLESVDLY